MALTINSTSIRPANSWQEIPKIRNKSQWRSINNTLHVDILDFPSKAEHILTFNFLTKAQWDVLIAFCDSGVAYAVAETETDHTFSYAAAYISLDNEGIEHTYGGGRGGVSIRISEK